MSEVDPFLVCIQETRFKAMHIPKLINWKIYFQNKVDCRSASGGVAICVKNEIFSEEIILNTRIPAVAIQTRYPHNLTVCNVYIPPPPLNIFDKNAFQNLIQQLPKPYILLGDFNAHHMLWGSNCNDTRGKIIENTLLNPCIDLSCLNTGKRTHCNIANGTESPSLYWYVFNDL